MGNLPFPCLTLVTERKRTKGRDLLQVVEDAAAGGVSVVQLREKDLPASELFALALKLRKITDGKCLFVVNDRLDVALAVGADGIHLPENGLPVSAVRKLAKNNFIVGRSTHSLDGALKAQEEGADYIHLGTIFPSQSKPGLEGAGVEFVRDIAGAIRIPVIAIGGIVPSNASGVMKAGAKGVAVISAITEADNVRLATAELRGVVLQRP